MKLGIFGGSFDPVHWGHVRPVQEARRRLGLDKVVYLPTATPPHKRDPESAPVAPAAARYAMVEMALLPEEGLFASHHELRPEEPSYTVETLEHFRRGGEEAGIELDLHLILGSDSLAELHTWRRWRDVLGLARLVVLGRPGAALAGLGSGLPELDRELGEALGPLLDRGDVVFVEDVTVDLSSTGIRRRLAEESYDGEWMEEALPPLVVDYLRKYRPYR